MKVKREKGPQAEEPRMQGSKDDRNRNHLVDGPRRLTKMTDELKK